MNVALVFPRFRYRSGDPPLGVAYLASAVRDMVGVHVDILDTTFQARPLRYLRRAFARKRYDIVGISMMSSMVSVAVQVAAVAKDAERNTFVIAGGPHPTVMPEQTLQDPNVDAVCIGEAETTFREMLDKFPELNGIQGLIYKREGEIVSGEPRDPIHNLDSIAPPAWELLSMRTYMRNWFQMDSVATSLPGTSIVASRGCAYDCAYCQPTLRKLFGSALRRRSPENVAQEVANLVRNFGLRGFMFQDDTFTFDREWALSVASAVHRSVPDVIWGCNVRADVVREEHLRELYGCGLRKVNIGIESASQRILTEIYRKRITVEQVKHAVHMTKRLGLNVQGYFMLGAPTETLDEVRRTIRLACELSLDDATFSITTPLPGTSLYDMTSSMIRTGTRDFDYYGVPVYETDQVLPSATLKALKREAYLRFYLSRKRWGSTTRHLVLARNPGKVVSKIRRFF